MTTVPAWIGYEHGTTACSRRGCPCGVCALAQWRRDQVLPPELPVREPSRYISADTRRAVYERDGWTCQLCMEPVDRWARWPSDWSLSLDHIQPFSRGGGNTVENLRVVHLWCNVVRGADDRNSDLFVGAADLAS